jgi:hypothetical protein
LPINKLLHSILKPTRKHKNERGRLEKREKNTTKKIEKKGRKNKEEKLRQRRRKRESGCVRKEEHETERGTKNKTWEKKIFRVKSLEILLKRFFRTIVYNTLSSSFHIFIFHS